MRVRNLIRARHLWGWGLLALAVWFTVGSHVELVGQPAATTAPATDDRSADNSAVAKALDEFIAAFKSGDAQALAAKWTPGGEYTDDEGETVRGRAALEKAYGDYFKANPGNALVVEADQVSFPSRDTAVVEGHFKVRRGKGELVVSRCSFLYVREDGRWLIAIAREWPGDGLSLRDLDWLIGNWEAKRDDGAVSTTYEWTANKAFIRCTFSVTQDGRPRTGMQMFGRNPATGGLRVWTFEDSGGVGEADVTRDGKRWMFVATGSSSDGRALAATNIMTPLTADSFTWQSVERAVDGEPVPDVPPVTVRRVKAK